jgi:hypothetical protein
MHVRKLKAREGVGMSCFMLTARQMLWPLDFVFVAYELRATVLATVIASAANKSRKPN